MSLLLAFGAAPSALSDGEEWRGPIVMQPAAIAFAAVVALGATDDLPVAAVTPPNEEHATYVYSIPAAKPPRVIDTNEDVPSLSGLPTEDHPVPMYAWPVPPLPKALAVEDEPAGSLRGQPTEDHPTLIFSWPVPPMPRAIAIEDEPAATLRGQPDEDYVRIWTPAQPVPNRAWWYADDDLPTPVTPSLVDDETFTLPPVRLVGTSTRVMFQTDELPVTVVTLVAEDDAFTIRAPRAAWSGAMLPVADDAPTLTPLQVEDGTVIGWWPASRRVLVAFEQDALIGGATPIEDIVRLVATAEAITNIDGLEGVVAGATGAVIVVVAGGGGGASELSTPMVTKIEEV